MDTDKDGTMSKDELNRYMDRQFDKAAVDHDGTLDANELGTYELPQSSPALNVFLSLPCTLFMRAKPMKTASNAKAEDHFH
jgi:hypothetical protein